MENLFNVHIWSDRITLKSRNKGRSFELRFRIATSSRQRCEICRKPLDQNSTYITSIYGLSFSFSNTSSTICTNIGGSNTSTSLSYGIFI